MPSGSWDQSLGDAKLYWLIDSEFAPNRHSKPFNSESASNHHSEPLDPEPASNPDLASNTHPEPRDGLGRLGDGAYGARRPPPQQSSYTPNPAQLNIMSLSPRKFKAYLAKLPTLSASYRDYLLDGQKVFDSSEQKDSVLYIVSQPRFSPQKFHRSFLAKHFSATSPPISTRKSKKITTPTVSVSQNIERQPHRIGGLAYTHFSPLETIFTTPPQLGFVFQEEPQPASRHFTSDKKRNSTNYMSLVGGIVTNMPRNKAHIYLPFYNPYHDVAVGGKSIEELNSLPVSESTSDSSPDLAPASASASQWGSKLGMISFNEPPESSAPPSPPAEADEVDPFRLQKAIAPIRITSFALRSPPTAVATYRAHLSRPKDLLNSVSLSLSSAVVGPKSPTANSHRVGSLDYSGHAEYNQTNRFDRGLVNTSRYGGSTYGATYSLPNRQEVKLANRPTSTSGAEHKKLSEYEAMFRNKSSRSAAKYWEKWGFGDE